MTLQEFKDALKESLNVTVEDGKKYLLFMDLRSVDREGFVDAFPPDEHWPPFQIVLLLPPPEKSVADCVAVLKIPTEAQ
jgi:hypothetical protein